MHLPPIPCNSTPNLTQSHKMAKLAVLLALLVAIAASPSIGKATVPREVPGFIYLGTARTTDGLEFNDQYYYASVNSGDWSRAEEDCKSVFGDTGHIISIESEAEQEFINKWLQDRGSGGTLYWTSGQFDVTGNATWRWAATGEAVDGLYTNWGPDEPSVSFGTSRIVLEHQNQFSAFWLSRQNTDNRRYVCEFPDPATTTTAAPTTAAPPTTADPTKPIECTTPNDLVVVLDSSGSIGIDNFSLLKEFVVQLAEAFTSTPTSRFGFVVYSESVATAVDLTEDLTPAQITDRIMAATYQAGPTPTDQGIAAATGMLTLNNNGNPRTYLVITDGISNLPEETKREAEEAVAAGIRTFSLGVTENVSSDELLAIAGGISENMFHVSDFDSVAQRLAEMSAALCP